GSQPQRNRRPHPQLPRPWLLRSRARRRNLRGVDNNKQFVIRRPAMAERPADKAMAERQGATAMADRPGGPAVMDRPGGPVEPDKDTPEWGAVQPEKDTPEWGAVQPEVPVRGRVERGTPERERWAREQARRALFDAEQAEREEVGRAGLIPTVVPRGPMVALRYRCQMCGAEDTAGKPLGELSLRTAMELERGGQHTHGCGPDRFGVAQLVGGMLVLPEEEPV